MTQSAVVALQEQKVKVLQVAAKANAGLRAQQITRQERDALISHYCGTPDERQLIAQIDEKIAALQGSETSQYKAMLLVVGFSVLMISLFAVLFYSTGGITGAAVLDTNVSTTYSSNASIPLTLIDVTRINVSGTAQGDANIVIALNENGISHELFSFRNGPVHAAHASLPKSRYVIGEPVIYTAQDVSSAYLITADQATPLDIENTTINDLAVGDYSIKLIINDTELTQEVLTFSVAESAQTPTVSFNTCGTVCDTNITANASIDITFEESPDSEGTLYLDKVVAASQQNRPPTLAHNVPDITSLSPARIDLNGIFSDADGDQLYYDTSHQAGMTETMENGTFVVDGAPGSYTYTIYASDLHELTPSNIFSVTILPKDNGTNETPNETVIPPNEQNATPNLSTEENSTPEIISPPSTDDCSNPDPNLRPLTCIQANDSTYFKPEQILIENKQAIAVGELTPVGNLLIKGGLVEHSTGQPSSMDYALGYEDSDGNFVATVWIDSDTGDLHLQGSLTEANGNIPIEGGLSAFANKRGIVLALVNRQTGDLTVRGNLVPYRRAFS